MSVSTQKARTDDGRDALAAASSNVTPLPLEVIRRPTPPEPSKRLSFRFVRFLPVVVGAVVLFAAGGLVGLYFQPPGLRKAMELLRLEPGGGTSTPIAVPMLRPLPEGARPGIPAVSPPRRFVAALGKLLPEGEVVTVAAPYGSGDARIAALPVKEGDRVELGGVLAVLDNERSLLAAVEAARATVGARSAMLEQARATTAAARDEAKAALARAEASADNALREFERAEELRRRGFASEQAYDQRRSASDEARREVERLRATLARYGSGPIDAQADVVVAARNLDAARADLARAETDLERATVRAPISGTVLTIHNRPGERPSSGGIMNLGDIRHMKVEIEVYQTQIGQVTLGQPVEVSADALPRPLRGEVARIGLEVGRQSLIDASPAANTDARVVKVTATLDADSTAIAARFTNLQVTARIQTTAAP